MTDPHPHASKRKTVAVLGGGITGLTAAYRLTTLGHRVRLFEKSRQLGGVLRSESSGSWLVESGPNSFQDAVPEVSALLGELNLDGERIEASPAARNRYLLRAGRLVAAPLTPPAFLTSPLFSVGGKARILSEMFTEQIVRGSDLSLADFIREHFGGQFVERALRPIVSGIFAGDADRLSAKHAFPRIWDFEQSHGSLLRGQMASAKARKAQGKSGTPPIISFRRGLQTLTDALAARLPDGSISRGVEINTLLHGARWSVAWNEGAAGHREEFDAVIAALPAAALARLTVAPEGLNPLSSLGDVTYAPVSSLFLGYRRDQVAHSLDGFGVLVPPCENRSILGVLFTSSLFAGRAPEGHVALTVMIGGAMRPDLAALPIDGLRDLAQKDLAALLGVTGEPAFVRHTYWPEAIPQYNLGHGHHLDTMATCERAHSGLFIGGNVRDGISLPNCVVSGLKLASRAAG